MMLRFLDTVAEVGPVADIEFWLEVEQLDN